MNQVDMLGPGAQCEAMVSRMVGQRGFPEVVSRNGALAVAEHLFSQSKLTPSQVMMFNAWASDPEALAIIDAGHERYEVLGLSTEPWYGDAINGDIATI